MNTEITLFPVQNYDSKAPAIALLPGYKINPTANLFSTLIQVLKKFERHEKKQYPRRKKRLKKRGVTGKRWLWQRSAEAFAEKTLFLLDLTGNRTPLLPTKDSPEKHTLLSVEETRTAMKVRNGNNRLVRTLLRTLPHDGKVVLRFGGKID